MKKMTLRNLHHATVAAEAAQKQPSPIIEADGKLVQDHSRDRATFQARFRATTYGDFKNRPGRSLEYVEAAIEDHERDDQKAVDAAAKAELIEAAAATGIVVEDHDLHRLADDGGPVHD